MTMLPRLRYSATSETPKAVGALLDSSGLNFSCGPRQCLGGGVNSFLEILSPTAALVNTYEKMIQQGVANLATPHLLATHRTRFRRASTPVTLTLTQTLVPASPTNPRPRHKLTRRDLLDNQAVFFPFPDVAHWSLFAVVRLSDYSVSLNRRTGFLSLMYTDIPT